MYDSFADIAKNPPGYKVLVVEDHPQWSEIMVSKLSALGFDVKQAVCVEQFQEIIREWVPDVVTLDIQLPFSMQEYEQRYAHEKNGMLIMRNISSSYPEVRVAVMTSIAWNDAVMIEMLRHGVAIHDYIDKKWDNAIDRLSTSVWRLSVEMQRGSRIPQCQEVEDLVTVSLPDGNDSVVRISDHQVSLSRGPALVFRMLVKSANTPVDRDAIVDALWSAEDLSDTYEDNLNTIIRRLRKEITEQTSGRIDGKRLVRSADGVYWIHGVIIR